MAIDFLNFALLLLSFVINLLALGAFWVTPGLRTNANRFTINLLIINLIGCLILATPLFMSNLTLTQGNNNAANDALVQITAQLQNNQERVNERIDIVAQNGNEQLSYEHNGKNVQSEGVILNHNDSSLHTIETFFKCNGSVCNKLTIDESLDKTIITETQQDEQEFEKNSAFLSEQAENANESIYRRSWCIDLTAALGALAVLLVVGDTWCAVTDPLRYHSRMSALRAWLLIALTWSLGILFGGLSALRELNFEQPIMGSSSNFEFSKHKRFVASYSSSFYSISNAQNIFGLIFACLYFVIIILMPFGFVCGMYWRIFSEARENGLRMRQNGSSPLLQSSLNLMHHQQAGSLQFSTCTHRSSISSASSQGTESLAQCEKGGLQMQIDRCNPNGMRRDSTVRILLPPISDDSNSEESEDMLQQSANHLDGNQNILFTLETETGEIKRNYSARQLALMTSAKMHTQQKTAENEEGSLRQIHSFPNLQAYNQLNQATMTEATSLQGTANKHCTHHKLSIGSAHSHVLQIPSHHSSHKGLGYMSSLRHRLSNASSLFKYREESRAARISILVVIMFLVSYLPFGFLVLLQSHLRAANFEQANQMAIFMLLLANMSSPFIFAYRNKRVRKGVKRLFGLEIKANKLAVKSLAGTNAGLLRRCKSVNSSYCNKVNQLKAAATMQQQQQQTNSKLAMRSNNSCSSIIQYGNNVAKNNNDIVMELECAKVNNGTSQALSKTQQQQLQLPANQQQIAATTTQVKKVEHLPAIPSKLLASQTNQLQQQSTFKWFFRKFKITETKTAVPAADV